MNRTLVGLYRDRTAAQGVVRDLVEAGIAPDAIGLLADDVVGQYRRIARASDRRREMAAARGAGTGAVFGAILGALIALAVAFLPATRMLLGPTLVSSVLASALIGLAIGGLLGWLAGARSLRSIPIPARHPDADAWRREGILVAAEVHRRQAPRVSRLMDRHRPIDLDKNARGWRNRSGWRPALEAHVHEVLGPGALAPGVGGALGAAATAGAAGLLGDAMAGRQTREAPSERQVEPDRRQPPDVVRRASAERGRRAAPPPEPRREASDEGAQGSAEGSDDWNPNVLRRFEPRLRQHYDAHYQGRGESWDLHRAAYELGLRLAWDARARPRLPIFQDIEGLARMRWESGHHGDIPFHRVRDSVAYAFEEGRLSYA